MPTPSTRTPEELSKFLNKTRRRFKVADDAERTVRAEALTDLQFRTGDQWNKDAKRIRDEDNRPCLTINRIPQFIHQVTNEQRQQRPSLQVNPEGNALNSGQAINLENLPDPRDSADIWQGLIRHIEVHSDAECAYDTAFENAVGNSFGWWRVTAEYVPGKTFDQEIVIKRILDAFSVYSDPAAKEPDRSDMKWAFVTSRMAREDFKVKYKDSDMVKKDFYSSFQGGEDKWVADWVTADDVTIAEYWELNLEKRKLQLLVANQDLLPSLITTFGNIPANADKEGNVRFVAYKDTYDVLPAGVSIENEREEEVPKVRWYKVTGSDILEEGDWPGRWIPLIPCLGDEVIVSGQKQLISLTRFIRDSQSLYNYFRSQQAEVIALTPKAPWIGAVGSFATQNIRWQNANNTNYAYLEHDIVESINGSVMPPPQRNIAEPPIQAINEAVLQANDDLKAGTGIYDPSLGTNKSDQSGLAIGRLKQQAEVSNFHFLDNFRRSMRHQGRILLDLIPHYYDRAERIIRIVKPDNEHELVMINAITEYKGKMVFFDPDVYNFDIVVEVGPSFQTKLEQSFELLIEMAKANPMVIQVAGDLIARSSPLPGNLGVEIADRLKAMLPPQVAVIANGNKPMDPQAQAALAQQGQIIQEMSQHIEKMSEIIKMKLIETESKERIAAMNDMVTLIAADLKAGTASAEALADFDFNAIKHRLDLLHQGVSLDQEMAMAAQQPQGQPAQPQAQAA